MVAASQNGHCAEPVLSLTGGPCLEALDSYPGRGVRRGLFHLVNEAPLDSAGDIVSGGAFFHCFEAFFDRDSRRCAVAAEHVALVLVLQSAAGTQGISCAAVDLLLLVADV